MPATSPSKKKLGLWTTVSLVVGNMIAGGVFLMPATLAGFGGISLLGWIVSAVGALLLANTYSSLAKQAPAGDGGPYAYTREGFGDFPGFLVAWGYWISCWCGNATITISFVGALSLFFPALATHAMLAILTGISAIALLTWINSRGIKASGNVQLATTILKLIPLVLVSVTGLFFIRWKNFIPFNLSGGSAISAITATATLTFYSFLGIECATIPSGNVESPEKIIPRATMLGTLISTLIYILGTVSVMGIIPAATLKNSVTPFADTAVVIWGNNAGYWVGAGVAIAAFGALNGWILITGQISSAIAKDHLFPAIFKKENKKGAPVAGLIISSILVAIIMLMNFTKGLAEQFRILMLMTTITVLVPYLFSAAADIVLINRRKNMTGKKRVFAILSSALAFLFCIWAVWGSGEKIILWGLVLLLAGVPLYLRIVWKRKQPIKN